MLDFGEAPHPPARARRFHGMLERKDNTLKFTPFDSEENPMQPRFLPVEDVSEFYVFGGIRASSSLYNFLGQEDIAVHFFDILYPL